MAVSSPKMLAGPAAVTYGSEVVLHDTLSGIHSTPLIIRKVDKGRIAPDDGGPVSQMQKIALQRAAPDGQRQYLSAAGPASTPGVVAGGGMSNQAGTHALVFQPPRVREEMKDGQLVTTDEVDDYLCWTIVGICMCIYLRGVRSNDGLILAAQLNSSIPSSTLSVRTTMSLRCP